MAELRQRLFSSQDSPSDTPSSPGDATPADAQEDGAEYKVVPTEVLDKLKAVKKKQGNKKRTFWIFALGGVFGIILAGFFASSNGGLDSLVEFAGMQDISLDSISDVLPAGLLKDVQDIQVRGIRYC